MSNQQATTITVKARIEAGLIAHCKAESPGWQTELVQWLNADSRWLLRRCTARLGNSSDAEDALQDVTLKILQAIERFEERSTLRTWVIRIADNHCYTLIKRRNATALSDHLQHNILLLEDDRYHSSGVEEEAEVQVNNVLLAMSENNREVLQLRFFGDQSLEDMASSLNLSLSATKMRLYRAMDVFKKRYEQIRKNTCDFNSSQHV